VGLGNMSSRKSRSIEEKRRRRQRSGEFISEGVTNEVLAYQAYVEQNVRIIFSCALCRMLFVYAMCAAKTTRSFPGPERWAGGDEAFFENFCLNPEE